MSIDKRDRIVRALLRRSDGGRLHGIVGDTLTVRGFGLGLLGRRLRVVRFLLVHDFAPHAIDPDSARRLWELSEQLLKA